MEDRVRVDVTGVQGIPMEEKTMKAEGMWRQYCLENGMDETMPYQAWQFGGAPDQLAELVLQGKKRGTSSAYDLYALDPSEPMLKAGDYSVILNSFDEAVCVIQTVETEMIPFNEISERHALLEGEGDLSLAWWWKVHTEFFEREYENCHLKFEVDTCTVLFEQFEVVYR